MINPGGTSKTPRLQPMLLWIWTCVTLMLLSACDLPPMDSKQQGYRGTGMVQIDNPEDIARIAEKNIVPDALPVAPATPGPKAGDIYQNVEVLGDLSVTEFVGMMTAITAWVSPEEGCTYCHAAANFATDEKYPKIVARRMLQMNKTINSQWTEHVADTGVTCYTCHRGKPVPEYIWFEGGDKPDTLGMAASRHGQNLASTIVGTSSLPYDPFSSLIESPDGDAAVASDTALPTGQVGPIANTEKTYALMMHMSQSLGVNCTYCHNSRAFSVWDQSTPARTTAWHGIRMVRNLNQEYLSPLQPVYPANRLGLQGDAPKANCSTCHQGIAKPLYGASMAKDYPALMAFFNKAPELDETQVAYSKQIHVNTFTDASLDDHTSDMKLNNAE